MNDKDRIKQLQESIREHNEHHLELAAERDRYRKALHALGYSADTDGNPVAHSTWDANDNGVIDDADEMAAYAGSLGPVPLGELTCTPMQVSLLPTGSTAAQLPD